MKKSTRLLVTLVVMTVGLMAAIPITLKYKLHHSMFTRINPLRDFPVDTKHFDNVKVVKVSGLWCELISADSFSLELEKRITPHTKTELRGDTLFVLASQTGGHIRIFSKDLRVIAKASEVTVRGSYDPYHFASYSVDLDNSTLYTQPIGSDHRIKQHIGDLSIIGINNSSVIMAGTVRMGELYLHDISTIELDKMVSVKDLKVEYGHPVIVKSHSHDGKMIVQIQ